MENSIGDRIEEKYTRYLNCETDTLELTIEEAIFILETDESLHYVEDLLQEAYKVILSDYKRVLKENESWKSYSEEIEEEQIEKNNKNCELEFEVEKLQKENVELKKKLKIKIGDIEYMQNKINNHFVSDVEIQENFIPTQKVKDKIEELNQYYKKEIHPSLYQWADITITEHYDEMIELLQELLEEGGENG